MRGGGGGGGAVYLCYSGPRLCRVGPEEEVSQWAQQFMPQNSDFPFQPTEPKRLSQQDLGVGEGQVRLGSVCLCVSAYACVYLDFQLVYG